jgi:hypothetical protein
MLMGDCYDIVVVFERPWNEVVDELDRQFGLVKETEHGPDYWYKHYDTRGFRLVFKGESRGIILKTTKPEWYGDVGFWVEVFSKSEITIVDFRTCTGGFNFVSGWEFMKFLGKLMDAGAVLIMGYVYGSERLEEIFGEWNQFLVYEWLEKALKNEKLEILPSDLTVVRKDLLSLEDGLYELIDESGGASGLYVRVMNWDGYRILFTVGECLRDDEIFLELIEGEERLELTSDITTVIFKRIGKGVNDELLLRRARECFKAEISQDFSGR